MTRFIVIVLSIAFIGPFAWTVAWLMRSFDMTEKQANVLLSVLGFVGVFVCLMLGAHVAQFNKLWMGVVFMAGMAFFVLGMTGLWGYDQAEKRNRKRK